MESLQAPPLRSKPRPFKRLRPSPSLSILVLLRIPFNLLHELENSGPGEGDHVFRRPQTWGHRIRSLVRSHLYNVTGMVLTCYSAQLLPPSTSQISRYLAPGESKDPLQSGKTKMVGTMLAISHYTGV